MKYPSKISYGLVTIVLVIIIGTSMPMVSPPKWFGLLINFLALCFIISIFSNTYYVVSGDILTVKSSFLVNKKIDINSIVKIVETNSIMSAPAASFDRLNLTYNNGEVMISPKDKTKFVEHLCRINPNVKVQ